MNTKARQLTVATLGAILLVVIGMVRPSFAHSSAADTFAAHTPSAAIENVVAYSGYAYGSWQTDSERGYLLLSEAEPNYWEVRCERSQDYLPIDMVKICDVPVPIARHLYTLREDGEGEYRVAQVH